MPDGYEHLGLQNTLQQQSLRYPFEEPTKSHEAADNVMDVGRNWRILPPLEQIYLPFKWTNLN